MFDPLFQALAWLLSFFYSLVPNYAVAVALLTLTVMLLLFPLNAKGMRSMAAMAKLSPEMKRIQAKYKNDTVKKNEETMALFKEHNVTPFGGCLPLLLQMPVLFIMYNIIRGLTHLGPDRTFDPKYLDHASKLYRDLHGEREMLAYGMDLAKTAKQVLEVSFVTAIPFLVLIAGVVGTGYYQQRMISRRNPAQAGDDNPMAKQMQQLTKIYPLMFLVFGFTLPAALNVYFLVSSAFRIIQQALIYKMDPSLLPGSGAATVASRDVSTPTPKPKPTASGGNGKNGKAPATPARVANRPAGSGNKKKKRR